jgi:hypothetical protein
MRHFTTDDCIFCWVSRGVLSGCNSRRKPEQEAACARCDSKLPQKGFIQTLRHVTITSHHGEVISTGYLAKVLKDSDKEEEWFVVHCRDGEKNKLWKMMGEPASKLQEWLKENNYKALWNSDPLLKGTSLIPLNKNERKSQTR